MRRVPLRRKTELKRKTPLRRTPFRQKSTLRRSTSLRKPWDAEEQLAYDLWAKAVTEGRSCVICATLGEEELEKIDWWERKKIDPHHILPARYIRRYIRSLRLEPEEAKELALRLLYDPRNGLCLCRHHHRRHERAYKRVPSSFILAPAWEFAAELDRVVVLELLYPE